MNCRDVRDRLGGPGEDRAAAPVRQHLEACESCALLARRWEAARARFESRADVEPGPEFAARVAARVRGRSADTLGRAALRFMPAAFALLLVLAWLSLQSGGETVIAAEGGSGGDDLVAAESIEDDLLSWILDADEDGR